MPLPPVEYVRTSDGYDIACLVAGAGRTIIRVPNMWNHVSKQWSPEVLGPTFDAFAERFRLILYDSRGQGLSTRNLPPTLSLDDYITDLEAVVEQFAPQRFVLDGWSFMGVIAMHYAVAHPERVEALVLHNYLDMHGRPTAGSMTDIAATDWPLFVDTTARMGWPQFDTQVIKRMLFDAASQEDKILERDAIAAVSGEALMNQIEVPILFLAPRTGSQPLAAEEATKRWAATSFKRRLVFFDHPGGSFSPFTADIIESYLAELDKAVLHDGSAVGQAVGLGSPPELIQLSDRECGVLRLLAAGRSNQQIADELVISLNTVRRHVSNIFDKTGVANRAQAAVYARDHGLT